MKSLRFRSASFLTLSLLLVTVAWWGCGGGGGNTTGGEPASTETAAGGTTTPPLPAVASLEFGKTVYTARCVVCHGESGKGDGPAGKVLNPPPRDHTNKAYMTALTDDAIRTTIREGKGAMPPHKEILSDVELESVLLYVRSLAV